MYKRQDLTDYKNSLEERFANPNIRDGVGRICSESSAKLPKFLIPTILESLVAGESIKYRTSILAVWCYYSDKRVDINKNQIEIIDERKEELHQHARQYEQDKLSFLRIPDIFGDLLEHERFITCYSKMIKTLYDEPNIHKFISLICQDNYLKK